MYRTRVLILIAALTLALHADAWPAQASCAPTPCADVLLPLFPAQYLPLLALSPAPAAAPGNQ